MTNNTIALYLYYRIHVGRPTPVKELTHMLQLSSTTIMVHNRILTLLKLVTLKKEPGVGKPNVPESVAELSTKRVEEILQDVDLLSSLSRLIDNRFNKYSPRGFHTNSIYNKSHSSSKSRSIKNKEKEEAGAVNGKSRRERSVDADNEYLATVLRILPEKHRNFYVVPKYLRALEKLAQDVVLEHYTRWFVKKKLGVTVHSFNLAIFLYEGILSEYRPAAKRERKVEKLKHPSGRKIRKVAARVDELGKEFEDAL